MKTPDILLPDKSIVSSISFDYRENFIIQKKENNNER